MNIEPIFENAEDLYQNAPFGYLSLRADGLIVNINTTLLTWLGFERNEVVFKKSFQDLLGMGEKIYYETHIMPMLQLHNEIAEINIELKGNAAVKLPALVNARRIVGQTNGVPFYRFSILDITQRKQFELELIKAKKDAELTIEQLKEMKEDLEQFAYIAAHDLKAPLRSINGVLNIINKKGDSIDDAQKTKFLNVVMTAAKDMMRMIENLLENSRNSTIQEDKQDLELQDIFNKVVSYFELELITLKGKITTAFTKKKITVYPVLFQRLLMNLISNAIKYRSQLPPLIQINCDEEKDGTLFSIKDNGIGIPQNQFEDIFKLFRSLKPDNDSNGIGLSVCKKIVNLHGGKIWVESVEGTGSIFYFTIPNHI